MRKKGKQRERGETSQVNVRSYRRFAFSAVTPLLILIISNMSEERVKLSEMGLSTRAWEYRCEVKETSLLSHLDLP